MELDHGAPVEAVTYLPSGGMKENSASDRSKLMLLFCANL